MIDTPMEKTSLIPWWHHVSIAAAYAATYEILQTASLTHWLLTCGLRLACLLLVSRHFWAALVMGELLPIAAMTLPMLPYFGIEWEMSVLVPPMIFCIPLVMLIQDHFPVFHQGGRLRTTRLLAASILCAAASTLRTFLALFVMDRPDGLPGGLWTWDTFLPSLIGAYLGALTFAPGILAIRERLRSLEEPLTWRQLMERSLFRDVVLFELPLVVGIQVLVHFVFPSGSVPHIQALFVIPVIFLSTRHGWHGTAVSGMVASIALGAPSLGETDMSIIPSEALLAFAISAWLIWANRRTPGSLIPAVAGTSAWIAILSLIPMQSIRRAMGPRYLASDGTLYSYDGSILGRAMA